MNSIELHKIFPTYFADCKDELNSEVWGNTLTINSGESYLIKAHSGRGKSSLCNFIYGLRHDYEGSILFDSNNISSYSINDWTECRKESISILFQDLRLFSELTVIENIELKNKLTNFKSKKEIINLLDALGIGSKTSQQLGTLSLGEQQRVAFIRALCQPYNFIILDEPVSHLDSTNGEIMAKILQEESTKQGAGIIVTSVGNNLNMQYDNRLCL